MNRTKPKGAEATDYGPSASGHKAPTPEPRGRSPQAPQRRIVMFSSGAGSWAAAKRVAEQHGTDGLILLFADTRMEDEDNYRFLVEATVNVGGHLEVVADGRDPWEVFFDVRFLGNTRVDPCSRVLKRELLRKWLETNCDPESTMVYLGFEWSEPHRVKASERFWAPWRVESPLCHAPPLSKADALAWLRSEGIEPPRLYAQGFAHANCGGFCIKGGQAQFATLLRVNPERYRWHEEKEEALRQHLDADVAILRDRTGGKTRPMTMREFRERAESQSELIDFDEWGGCGCMSEAA